MGTIKHDLREKQVFGPDHIEHMVTPAGCPTLGFYQIASAGLSEVSFGFEWVRLRTPVSVVLVCTGGRGRVLVDEVWRVCGEGEAYLVPQGVPHAFHAIEGARWHLSWVAYEQPWDQAPIIAPPTPTLVRLDPWPLRGVIEGLYRESIGSGDQAIMHHWAELIHLYTHRVMRRCRGEDRLRGVWESVNADLARPWTTDELAGLACMSGEYLRRLCQRQLGRSPGQHLAYLRMQRASSLLKTTDWTIAAIARAVGYGNPFAFSNAFRRWMGISPSAYRDEMVAFPASW